MKDVPDLPEIGGATFRDVEPPAPLTLDRWVEMHGVEPSEVTVVDGTPATPAPAPQQATTSSEVSRDDSGEYSLVRGYLPREVAHTGMSDLDLLKRCHDELLAVLLYGPPGTGKTALARATFGDSLVTVVGTVDTDTTDLVGSWVPTGDRAEPYRWVDGPLTVAVREGRPLLVDEIALIDPRVLSVMYSLMDGRDTLFLPSNPAVGQVPVAPGFYVVGACNPDAPGAVMSDALLSRFAVHLSMDTPYEMLTRLEVAEDIILAARNLATLRETNEVRHAPQTRELLVFTRVRETLGLQAALANLVGTARPGDRQRYADVLTMTFGREVRPLGA